MVTVTNTQNQTPDLLHAEIKLWTSKSCIGVTDPSPQPPPNEEILSC